MYRVIHERKYDIPKDIGAVATPDGALALIISYCEEYDYRPIIRVWNKLDRLDTLIVDVAAEDDWFLIVNEEGNLLPRELFIPVEYTQDYISLPTESLEDFECPF